MNSPIPLNLPEITEPAIEYHAGATDISYWSDTIRDDFIKFFLGEKLGDGVARCVYEIKHNPDLVAKVELTSNTFQNHKEWEAWSIAQFTQFGNLLVPCRRISPCGHILIQERTYPLKEGEIPSTTASFIEDRKLANYGRTEAGHIVCHDYALNNLMETGIKNAAIEKYIQE